MDRKGKIKQYKSLPALRRRMEYLASLVNTADKSMQAARQELWVLYAQEKLMEMRRRDR